MKKHFLLVLFTLIIPFSCFAQNLVKFYETEEKGKYKFWIVPAKNIQSCFWEDDDKELVIAFYATTGDYHLHRVDIKSDEESVYKLVNKIFDPMRKEILSVKVDDAIGND